MLVDYHCQEVPRVCFSDFSLTPRELPKSLRAQVAHDLELCPANAMEEDRAEANIGQAIDDKLLIKEDVPRHPKKRFIGRRAATERAVEQGVSQGTIEDSGAIQGS